MFADFTKERAELRRDVFAAAAKGEKEVQDLRALESLCMREEARVLDWQAAAKIKKDQQIQHEVQAAE
jgi:hypothetical protein